MKRYTVYFELFGKKMKTTVDAVNELQAQEYIRNQVIFHKVQQAAPTDDDVFNFLFDSFNKNK